MSIQSYCHLKPFLWTSWGKWGWSIRQKCNDWAGYWGHQTFCSGGIQEIYEKSSAYQTRLIWLRKTRYIFESRGQNHYWTSWETKRVSFRVRNDKKRLSEKKLSADERLAENQPVQKDGGKSKLTCQDGNVRNETERKRWRTVSLSFKDSESCWD